MSAEEIVASRVGSLLPRVSIVGVGGAGNNLLSRVIGGVILPSHCVAVNTDRGQLSRSPAVNKVLLGSESAGEPGSEFQHTDFRKMLQLSAHRVRPFTETSDFTIVIAGLGGGTATGTAPLIAQSTRSPVRPVVSVVAIPFIHERERRFVALRGLKHMVEACDCTIVVDNAMEDGIARADGRQADEKASLAVRSLTELVSGIEPALTPEVLRILSLGQIGVFCSARLRPTGTFQGAVIQALRDPSASLPFAKTKGAILLHRGPTRMGDGEAARAYEALESLLGTSVEFLHASVESPSDPMVCLLLTGYEYGTAVHAFVDFIEDLYDVEYGQPSPNSFAKIEMGLFQMER